MSRNGHTAETQWRSALTEDSASRNVHHRVSEMYMHDHRLVSKNRSNEKQGSARRDMLGEIRQFSITASFPPCRISSEKYLYPNLDNSQLARDSE